MLRPPLPLPQAAQHISPISIHYIYDLLWPLIHNLILLMLHCANHAVSVLVVEVVVETTYLA